MFDIINCTNSTFELIMSALLDTSVLQLIEILRPSG